MIAISPPQPSSAVARPEFIREDCRFCLSPRSSSLWDHVIGVLHQKRVANVVTQMETSVSAADSESVIQVYKNPGLIQRRFIAFSHSASVCHAVPCKTRALPPRTFSSYCKMSSDGYFAFASIRGVFCLVLGEYTPLVRLEISS